MALTPGMASQLYVSLLTLAVAALAYLLLRRRRVARSGEKPCAAGTS